MTDMVEHDICRYYGGPKPPNDLGGAEPGNPAQTAPLKPNENFEGRPHPEVTRRGIFDMQVCVPAYWTDDQAKAFADRENLCGTESGWTIRRQGDPALLGSAERVPCASRAGCVHIMLDA